MSPVTCMKIIMYFYIILVLIFITVFDFLVRDVWQASNGSSVIHERDLVVLFALECCVDTLQHFGRKMHPFFFGFCRQ